MVRKLVDNNVVKKCQGGYSNNNHTCVKTCETLTNMLKANIDVSEQLIKDFEYSLEYYCNHRYKSDELVVLYSNKYHDKNIYKLFTRQLKDFKSNLIVFKEIEKQPNNNLKNIQNL